MSFVPGWQPTQRGVMRAPWAIPDFAAGVVVLILITVALSFAVGSFVRFADDGLTAEALVFLVAAMGLVSGAGALARFMRAPTMQFTRVVVLVLLVLGVAVGFSSGEGMDREFLGLAVELILTVGVVVANIAVVLLFTVQKHRVPWSRLGFVPSLGRYRTLGSFGLWLAGLGLIASIDALMRQFDLEFLTPPQNAQEALESFHGQLIPSLIAVGILVPIGEEMFFRGFALPALHNRVGPVAAVVLSAMLFALFHVDPGLYLPTFILGVSLGIARVWTGSLWPPIMIHMAQNLLALGVAYQQVYT